MEDNKKIWEAMKSIMDTFWQEMETEAIKAYESKKEVLSSIWIKFQQKEVFDISDFHFDTLFPFEMILEGYLLKEIWTNTEIFQNNYWKIEFLLKNIQFVENQFENIIKKEEWYSCSADKSSFIIQSLFRYLSTWIEMKFDAVVQNWKEYSYHIPKKVFNNQESILNFFDAIMSMYYWDIEKLLLFYNNNMFK